MQPHLSDIEANTKQIVLAIGREAVDVYQFIASEFDRLPVIENRVFQFVYRSFYRLDNAGLTEEFKLEYFKLLSGARRHENVDLEGLTKKLFTIRNLRGRQSLQFSFVTKLASTVNPDYPVYDSEVASVFGFRAPYNYKSFKARLQEYMAFYGKLQDIYAHILEKDRLRKARRMFRETYNASPERIHEVKVLDFIFWSAGKLSFEAEQP